MRSDEDFPRWSVGSEVVAYQRDPLTPGLRRVTLFGFGLKNTLYQPLINLFSKLCHVYFVLDSHSTLTRSERLRRVITTKTPLLRKIKDVELWSFRKRGED